MGRTQGSVSEDFSLNIVTPLWQDGPVHIVVSGDDITIVCTKHYGTQQSSVNRDRSENDRFKSLGIDFIRADIHDCMVI